jgi:ATP-binding cassette subfamily B protein
VYHTSVMKSSVAPVTATRLVWRNYWAEIKRYKLLNAVGMALPGVGTIFVMYVPPLIVARLLARFSNTGALTLDQVLPYVLAMGGFWALGEFMWRVGIHFTTKTSAGSMKHLYIEAMDKLLEKDQGFFHDNFAGSLTKKALGYARRFEDFFDSFLFNIVPEILPLPFIAYVLWQFSPWLIVVLLGMLTLTGFIILPLVRRRMKLVAIREEASNITAGHVSDVIANADAVKAFAREDFERQQHARNVNDQMAKTYRSWAYQNYPVDVITSPFYVLTNVFGLALALFVSHQSSTVSLAAVFVSFSYFATITRVMWQFGRIYRNMESAISEAAQFTELLLEPPRLTDASKPKPLRVKSGTVQFQNVRFRYDDGSDEHLFDDFNLQIDGGQKIALVGHSGGGKTTITKLLLRFVDINGGQILIDGQDIAQVRQQDLRSQIAYVPQESVMFHRSIADNIRYGKLDATDEQIQQAARGAHAHEFITKLPQGYDTLIGERGIKLSGGQRQRIAIARAMLKNAPILILDEATSALDSESEVLIQKALWKLMEGRTAIVIAHRLSTIQKMDRIVVLDNGHIAETGTHKELLQHKGIYAKLWAHQSGGFLEE